MAMAETPKRSFTRTVASTVEGRTPRFLLGSLALAMVISLVAGLGIGVKIGEHDNKTVTPVTTGKAKPAKKPKPRTNATAFARPPVKATIVRTTPRLVVVKRGARNVAMTLNFRTRIDLVRDASRADIKAGARVLFVIDTSAVTPTTSGDTTTSAATATSKAAKAVIYAATDVLVLRGTAKIGSRVASVTGDSMTFRARNGKTVTISTAGATISKTIPGKRDKLLVGRHVLVKSVVAPAAAKNKKKTKTTARVVKRPPVAVEIIALPDGSPFA